MCPGKREIGGVVVERTSSTGRMAGIAGITVPRIASDPLVLVVHVGLVMRMAVDATENAVIVRIRMAVGTGFPLTAVIS